MMQSYLTKEKTNQRNRFRITLDITAYEDFNPHQINWRKLFELNSNEVVKSYVEDLS